MKLFLILALNTIGIAMMDVTDLDRVWVGEEFEWWGYLVGPLAILIYAVLAGAFDSLKQRSLR